MNCCHPADGQIIRIITWQIFIVHFAGFTVSNATFNAIIMRYSDKDGRIEFDEFVSIYIKLRTIFGLYSVIAFLFPYSLFCIA
jgi:hypothetical protein